MAPTYDSRRPMRTSGRKLAYCSVAFVGMNRRTCDLRGVVDREKAPMGVLLTLEDPTKAMRTEAASARFYNSPWGQHPKLQIVTVGEFLDGKRLDAPPT